jgi:hypothetical protein
MTTQNQSLADRPIIGPDQEAHRQLLASKVRSFIDFIDGYFGDPPYWD